MPNPLDDYDEDPEYDFHFGSDKFIFQQDDWIAHVLKTQNELSKKAVRLHLEIRDRRGQNPVTGNNGRAEIYTELLKIPELEALVARLDAENEQLEEGQTREQVRARNAGREPNFVRNPPIETMRVMETYYCKICERRERLVTEDVEDDENGLNCKVCAHKPELLKEKDTLKTTRVPPLQNTQE